MNYLFKSGFFALILLISSYAPAADTEGWYSRCCQTTEIHFTKFPGQLKSEEFRIKVYSNLQLIAEPSIWRSTVNKISGQRCSSAGKCEEATKADFQIQRTSTRGLRGRYIFEINGKHFEDQFSIKIRRAKGPTCICE